MELFPGIYHVGSFNGGSESSQEMECHPYLLIDDQDAVLFDPGSVLDYRDVTENIKRIIGSLDRITLIVVHHQDPDLCGSLPLLRKEGVSAPIALHRRTKSMVRYYGVGGAFYVVNENRWLYRLRSGRIIRFLPAPYLHFAGSFMSFDPTSGTLFSGDLFGAMTRDPGLFAGPRYYDAMKTFHEHYMPSHEILGPVMSGLLEQPVRLIAPQHGRIIRENIREAILILKDLSCGTYLAALPPDHLKPSGRRSISYPGMLTDILNRLAARFGEDVVRSVLPEFPFAVDPETLKVNPEEHDPEAWHIFFEVLYRVKGASWLSSVEPHVFRLVRECDVPVPRVVGERLAGGTVFPDFTTSLNPVSSGPEARNQQFSSIKDSLVHDTVTELYNQRFFWSLLEGYFSDRVRPYPFALAHFSIDNLMEINRIHGRTAGDETLRSAGFFLKNMIREGEDHGVFKLNAPVFAYFFPQTKREEARKRVEEICADIRFSDLFLEKITLSAGLIYGEECPADLSGEKLIRSVDQRAHALLRLAIRQGGGTICDHTDDTLDGDPDRKVVLIAETDPAFMRFLKSRLEQSGFRIIETEDGEAAWNKVLIHKPDLILSEVFLPKLSGFDLRERLLTDSTLAGIPFILVSFRKTEEDIRAAALLKILHYFRKPVSAAEIEGVVQNCISGGGP